MDQGLPPLARDDLRELRTSIEEHGVREPIVVDEWGKLIDGHHRKMIADELGIDCPERTVTGLNELEKWELAMSLNAHRRHLTITQRREIWGKHRVLASQLLAEDPTRSDRAIASELGVDNKTVGKVRSRLEANEDIPVLERRGRGLPVEKLQTENNADHRNDTWFKLAIGYACESEEMRRRGDKVYPQASDRLEWHSGQLYLTIAAPRTDADADALIAQIAQRIHREMRSNPLKTVNRPLYA